MRNGFSLVELSIVLVILGLLVGGVLTGQSLIRAAELRSVSTEFAKYQAAVNTFRDKYFQLPGDMNNATSFWGAAHATPATCLTTVGTGTQTCNGDGDGLLDPAAAASQYGEIFTFWQYLANAGLIEGAYTGRSGPSNDGQFGGNIPRAKMSNSGWAIYYWGTFPVSDLEYFEGAYNNSLMFGTKTPNALAGFPALRPEEAWNIDVKMDDGLPANGNLVARERDGSATDGCSNPEASGAVGLASTASYDLNNSAISCSLIFRNVF